MACYKNKAIIPLKNPAKLKIGKLKCKIPLVQLRVLLFLANLIVLASAVASFSAGRDARSTAKNLLNQEKTFKPDTKDDAQVYEEWMSAIRRHVEQILYTTSLNLLLYWFIYGVAISLHFFGSYSVCVLVISVPHTLIMILWELGITAFFVKMSRVDDEDGFYAAWTPTLVVLLLPTCVVQLLTSVLPFCVENSQCDYNNNQENGVGGEVRHTNTPVLTKSASTLPFTNTDYVDFASALRAANTDPEVCSLYHTEMPEQILKKNRPGTIARIRKTSVSAGQRVMDTMGRVYNSERFVWRLGHESNSSYLSDQAGWKPGRYMTYTTDDYMNYTNDDYVDKSYNNDDYVNKIYNDDYSVDKIYNDDDYVDKSYADDDYMEKRYTDYDYVDMRAESPPPSYHSQEFLA